MPSNREHLVLSLFYVPGGHHLAGWRHPRSVIGRDVNIGGVIALVKRLEQCGYSLFFVADLLRAFIETNDLGRRYPPNAPFEPLTLLSAIAPHTKSIGLGATVSSTYSQPFTLARQLASLDHISGGRAAWNVVTGDNSAEAKNFGTNVHPSHEARYARAKEFVSAAKLLWAGWESDAFCPDKCSGIAFNPSKIHAANFKGEYLTVAGPLPGPRSPQGNPVIVQAGKSEHGLNFAAESAEIVFTSEHDLASARAYASDLRSRARSIGRDSEIIILPGLLTVVGETETEAQDKFKALQDLIDPELGLRFLSSFLGGADLSKFSLDEPLPDLPEFETPGSRNELVRTISQEEGLTLRELTKRVCAARGHHVVVASAERMADIMVEWFESGAADGFNLMPPYSPETFEDFNKLVLPILQKRGLVALPSDEPRTLRQRLNLVQ